MPAHPHLRKSAGLAGSALSTLAIPMLATGVPATLGMAAGRISQVYGGDRKRNALVGGAVGLAPGGLAGYRLMKAVDLIKKVGLPVNNKTLMAAMAIPTLAGGVSGWLGGSLFGPLYDKPAPSRKEGLLDSIRNYFRE